MSNGDERPVDTWRDGLWSEDKRSKVARLRNALPKSTQPDDTASNGTQSTGTRSEDTASSGARSKGRQSKGTRAERAKAEQAKEIESNPEQAARAICLRLLTDRPRTRAELADALRAKEIPDEAAEKVLARFGEVGLINDASFAESWVESRHRGRGLARRALAAELYRKGIESETAQEALETLDPDTERETAARLVRRRLPSTRGLAPEARTRRLLGMLARKGYPAGVAAAVIREELRAESEEAMDEQHEQALDLIADSDET